jgi:hypothetical protein
MDKPEHSIEVTLRIPGNWDHPSELFERMPEEYRLAEDALILPNGQSIEMSLLPPDEQFASVFSSACRQRASDAEMEIVNGYTVNIALTASGGSLQSAHQLMKAAAAFIRAGAGGVFIDNSGLSHGGSDWLEMTDEGSSDAISFAFVSMISGQSEVWTMGMHVLGFPDVVMRQEDLDADGEQIIELIRYVCGSERPVGDGHILADEIGPRFRCESTKFEKVPTDTPMRNPIGYLRLVSMKDVVGRN